MYGIDLRWVRIQILCLQTHRAFISISERLYLRHQAALRLSHNAISDNSVYIQSPLAEFITFARFKRINLAKAGSFADSEIIRSDSKRCFILTDLVAI